MDLAKADFILSSALIKLSDFTSPVVVDLRNNLMTRINQRRTIWSDVFMNLSFDDEICKKSLFYTRPTTEILSNAIDFIEPHSDTIQQDSPNTEIDLDDLISGIPKRSKSELSDIHNFQQFGVLSERLNRAQSILSTVRPTSIDSERCFSVCGRLIAPLRTRLSDKKFETIIFIHENKDN